MANSKYTNFIDTNNISEIKNMKNELFSYKEKDWYMDVSVSIDGKSFWKKAKIQDNVDNLLYNLYVWLKNTLNLYKNPKLVGLWQYETDWLI